MGDKKMESKINEKIRLKEKMESKMEEEISWMKDREEKEKEMQRVLEKEKKNKEKIEVAKNVLLGAILLEQMLGLFMQDMQDEAYNREFGMWPEEIRENKVWDIGVELNKVPCENEEIRMLNIRNRKKKEEGAKEKQIG